jgi:hypothetical protein
MAQTLQNQLLMTKSMNGIISFDDGAGSTITNGSVISNNISGTNINASTLTTTDTNITGTIDLNPVATSITINNFGFATPAQALNNFSTIPSPWGDPSGNITNWTITLVSGTAPSVFVGRGFTALVNLYETAFPEYPYFKQYVSFQSSTIYQMRFTQSLTFAKTGNYILTFYIWGEYNRYSPTNNISVSCGNNSINNFTASEGAWKKVIMKFQIITAGSNTLTILVNNTSGTDSGISFSGVKIVGQNGLVVYDGGNTNNQLITPKGLYTSGFINNQGNIANYGNFINYGPLNLVAPYSAGTLVIGSSLFGTTNSDSGRYSTLIGSQVVGSAGYTPVNLDACVFIGYAAGEQTITGIRNHGIGYQSNRWAQNSSCYDNVGYGYQSNYSLGYAGGSNCFGNVSIGNFTLSGAYSSNNYLNTVIGHGSLSGVDFTNSRSCNTICGAVSLQNIQSNFNSSLGYNNGNGIVNTASEGNIFIGTNVCNSQSGSGNVLFCCTFIGSDTNVSTPGNYSNSTCIGTDSRITASNCIFLGTFSQITFAMGGLNIPVSTNLELLGDIIANSATITPTVLSYISTLSSNAQTQITDITTNYLTSSTAALTYQTISGMSGYLTTNPVSINIANKINLAKNQTAAGTTLNLSFSTAENVLLTNGLTTTINLPTPNVDGRNEGCKFNIYRKVAGVAITINAPSGQTLSYYQSDATYISAGSYFLNAGNGSITVLCIASAASGTNWQILPPSISQATDNIYLGTTNPYSSTALSISFGGTTTSGYNPVFIDNGNLNYKQSTTTLTATNMYSTTASTGDMTVRANLKVNLNFLPYQVIQLLSTATVLPNLPNLYGLYTFVSGASATTIVLPTITADIVGCQLSFRRVSNTTSSLIVKTPSGSGQTIVQRASITETAAFTDYIFLSTTQYYGTIVAITTTKWSALG